MKIKFKVIMFSLMILFFVLGSLTSKDKSNLKTNSLENDFEHYKDLINKTVAVKCLRLYLKHSIESNNVDLLTKVYNKTKAWNIDFKTLFNKKIDQMLEDQMEFLSPEYKVLLLLYTNASFV